MMNDRIQPVKYAYAFGFTTLLFISVVVLSGTPASAQGSQELLKTISQKMGQSMQALTGYSYQQRTEVQVKGETKSVQLVQVSFGPNRQPLITPISAPPPQEKGHGLKGRIKEKKTEEMKEDIQHFVSLSNSYLMPGQDKLQQLVRMGQAMVNPDNGNVRVDVLNFLQPRDQMTILCDGMTKNRLQTQVQTTAEGSPMMITAQYQTSPAGLNYNAQTVISVPSKGLRIMINTMNYQRQ